MSGTREIARDVAREQHGGSERYIECLECGLARIVPAASGSVTGACPSCGYLGWTFSAGLSHQNRYSLYGRTGVPVSRAVH